MPEELHDPLAPISDSDSPEAAPHDPPVTVLVSRRIREGGEDEFKKLLDDLAQELAGRPGFCDLKAYEPSAEDDEHKVVVSFDSASNLRAWQDAPERKSWLARVKPLEAKPPRTQVLTGLETWFTLPEQEGMKPPPRHKMAMVTWLGVFPVITLVNALLVPHIENLPVWGRSAIVSGLMVSMMTYGIMPRMTRLCAKWLYPQIEIRGKETGDEGDGKQETE